MARSCSLTGKGVQTGNNVSHSNRKTRRRFLPNIQNITLRSELLKRDVTLKLPASSLRTVEHNGGLDNFLLTTSSRKLTEEAVKLQRKVRKAQKAAA